MRKKGKLTIQDKIKIEYNTSDRELKDVFEKYKTELLRQTLADKMSEGGGEMEKVKVNGREVGLKIKNQKSKIKD